MCNFWIHLRKGCISLCYKKRFTKSNTISNQKTSTKIPKNIIENCNAHEKCRKKYVTKNKVVLLKINWITTEKTSENFVLSPFVSFYFPRWLHPNLGIGSIFNKITSTTLHSHCTHHIPRVKLGKTVFNWHQCGIFRVMLRWVGSRRIIMMCSRW
jgi:hypothetical protein